MPPASRAPQQPRYPSPSPQAQAQTQTFLPLPPAPPPSAPFVASANGYAPYHGHQPAGPSRLPAGPHRFPSTGAAAAPPHLQQPFHSSYPAYPHHGGYQVQAPGLHPSYIPLPPKPARPSSSSAFSSPSYQQQQQQQQQHFLPLPPHGAPMVSSPVPMQDRLPNPYDRPSSQSTPSGVPWLAGTGSNGNLDDRLRMSDGPPRRQSSGTPSSSSRRRTSRTSSSQSGHATSPVPPPLPRPQPPSSSSADRPAGSGSSSSRRSSSAPCVPPLPSSRQASHEYDDCPGCRAELEEALAASLASAREDEERRKQRESDQMQDVFAISASERDQGRRQLEEERRMLEQVVEDSKREAEDLLQKRAEEEERILEESRKAAMLERARAAQEEEEQMLKALQASQAEEQRRAEALQRERDAERAAIEESMRQQEEEWKRRESEERSIVAFLEHQSKLSARAAAESEGGPSLVFTHPLDEDPFADPADDHEISDADYWRFAGHSEAYDVALKMSQLSVAPPPMAVAPLGGSVAGPSRTAGGSSARRPLPPVPGPPSSAIAAEFGSSHSVPTTPKLDTFSVGQIPLDDIPPDAPPTYEAATAPTMRQDSVPMHEGGPTPRPASTSAALERPTITALQGPIGTGCNDCEAPSPVDSFTGPSPSISTTNSAVHLPAADPATPQPGKRNSSLLKAKRRSSSSRHELPDPLSSAPPPLPLTETSLSSSSTGTSASEAMTSSFDASPAAEPTTSSVDQTSQSQGSQQSEQQPQPQQPRGQKAIAGVDFGFGTLPFATQLEKAHQPSDGDSGVRYFFPNTIQLRSVVGSASSAHHNSEEVGTRGTYFVIRAHSWKSLLRAMAWYGNTRIEPGPEEVVDAAAASRGPRYLLRIEIEFVTPTKAEIGYGVGEYARYVQNGAAVPRASKAPAHVAICMSLLPSTAAARTFHQSAAYKAAQTESKRLDAFYAGRGSARRIILLPRQAPSLPLPMVKLAQHLHMAHTFSAACPSSSHIARHSPRDLHHAIERHDEGFIKRQKAMASAAAVLQPHGDGNGGGGAGGGTGSGGNGNASSSSSLALTKTTTTTGSLLATTSRFSIDSGARPSSVSPRPSSSSSSSLQRPAAQQQQQRLESGDSGDKVSSSTSLTNLMHATATEEGEIDFNDLAVEDGGLEQDEAMGKRARLKAKVKRRLGKRAGDGNVVDEDLATWITPFDVNPND